MWPGPRTVPAANTSWPACDVLARPGARATPAVAGAATENVAIRPW